MGDEVESMDDRYALVQKDPLTRKESWVFALRLLWMFFTAPILSYVYLRASRLEGYSNPKMLGQAISLRLGRNAVQYPFDPLRPKQLARIIRDVGA